MYWIDLYTCGLTIPFVLHSRERREIFQSMSEISASNFVVAYVKKQAGIKKRVAHKNIIMTRDERWKVNLFTAHPR